MKKKSKTILIIEDEVSERQALVNKFSLEGFDVSVAKDGLEGLAKAFKEHPDMILLDVIMPEMDGMTMLKKLREDEWGQDVPVIILTNLSDAENTLRAVKGGVYDFLVKTDWTLESVVHKVKQRLGLK